jgi:hypothetical protein
MLRVYTPETARSAQVYDHQRADALITLCVASYAEQSAGQRSCRSGKRLRRELTL